ncbi:NAD(P)H-hydrate dehydratase [Suttonella sp. R2A3]|uniref:NAD(P)H-hydrate dehydratase n=1 Tax=Suttonella sp. R2A3 TaxID=2908648 RepID=UPI001F471B64|nr:NAD(P)H-hydrate dehydratase [Suttonella sp. R2A3]UJF24792.1 NAD(P)H-hydrate dehydratase [Suttonella sp. R2A3]
MLTFPIVEGKMIASIDQAILRDQSMSHQALMEEAARACSVWIDENVSKYQPIVVCCGPGNNGGDGLAIARRLMMAGFNVNVYADQADKGTLQHQQFVRTQALLPIKPLAELSIEHDAVVIDALFGVGIRGALRSSYKTYVEKINAVPNDVIAIDTPSGLGDTLLEESSGVVQATHTLSLCTIKHSQLFSYHDRAVGNLHLIPLPSARDTLSTYIDQPQWLTESWFQRARVRRNHFAHKGTHGRVSLCAGSGGMIGAAVLSAKAGLRAGVGLLRVHCDMPLAAQALHTAIPEAMYEAELPKEADILAIGPGWGKTKGRDQQLAQLLVLPARARVIDADALNILAHHPGWLEALPPQTVLTPHPGEFARLTGEGIPQDDDRIAQASAYAKRWRCTVVLKGRYSVIAAADGRVWVNSSGNSGLAKGGSGDVLTGIIAALLAQGLSAEQAAAVGVYWHGKAADRAIKTMHPQSLLASDVIEHLGVSLQR